MPKEKAPPKDTSGEVPPWFMTYSDVITLLMTFFILLLTFASHEPEMFDRMQVTAFGAGGSDGMAGEKSDTADREAVTFRYRPQKARVTRHGTTSPPTDSDVNSTGPTAGMLELEEASELAQFQRLKFSTSRNSLFNEQGLLTPLGQQRISMISRQLNSGNMRLSITVPGTDELGPAVQLAHDMTYGFGVPIGRVAVGVASEEELAGISNQNNIHFTLLRETVRSNP